MSLLKRRMLFGRAWALGGWKVLALTGLATSPYQGVYSPPGLWCGYGQILGAAWPLARSNLVRMFPYHTGSDCGSTCLVFLWHVSTIFLLKNTWSATFKARV